MKFLNQSLVALLACLPVIWQSVIPPNNTNSDISTKPQDSSSSDLLDVPLSQLQNNNLIDLDAEFLNQLRREQNERLLANPNEFENFSPLDYYIIYRMAQWGFEYFQKELEYYKNGNMRIILNKHFFSYNDFELVCELMDNNQQDWTELELIRLLEIRVECLASGEVKEKIITTVAMGIFEERVRETIATLFWDIHTEIIKKALAALRHPSVSIENGILQLDGSKIMQLDDEKMIMKYFLMRAKTFAGFSIVNFNFTHEIIYQIGEQFKNGSFIFYPSSKQATFCLGKDFGEFSDKTLYSRNLSFTAEKTENISSLLTTIPDGSLMELNVFHPEVNEFASNPNVFLNKIEKCEHFAIKSDISAELFEDFYFKMKESFLANFIDNTFYFTNYLNLFSSPTHQSQHAAFFQKKRNTWDWNENIYLDLREFSQGIPQYEVTNYSLKTATHLLVSIGKNARLDLLEKAFDNKNMLSIQIDFQRSFNQFNQLIEIIRGKTLQSLIINPAFDEMENGLKFIDDLIKTSFWIELKHLEIFHVSLKVISKVLDSLPSNLQKLELILPESSNGEFDSKGESLKYPSVRELKIKTYGNFDCTKDIEQLPLLFPNLERLTVDNDGPLKLFEIKNNQLTELSIICSELEEGDKFIKELINSPTLTLGNVKIGLFNITKWKKHEGRIYYEIGI